MATALAVYKARFTKSKPANYMQIDNLREVLAQASEDESREIVQDAMCRMVRLSFFEAMEAEVTSLCGRKHYPDAASNYQRAGSEKGVAYLNGEKEGGRHGDGRRDFKPFSYPNNQGGSE